MSPRVFWLLLAGICLGASTSALSQTSSAITLDTTPIGKIVTAAGTVRVEHSSAVIVQANLPPEGVGQVKAGDLIYRGDKIQTGPDGGVGITFTDGTAFNVAKNARMEVDEFVYDPNGNSNTVLFTLSTGTFSFIAGAISKTGDMKADTPVGVVGIRGTAPRIEISEDGSVKFSTLIEEK
jgi:hypothetical protein